MANLLKLKLILFTCLFLNAPVFAQIDEIREITGLPIPIGAAVIYGQVVISNFPRGEKRPSILVFLESNGSQVARYQANDRGYYFFLKRPAPGSIVVFEIDGINVGRVFLTPTGSDQVRQDATVDWRMLRGSSNSATGVISANEKYPRDTENEKMFENGMKLVREKKNSEATELFQKVVATDPKDYLAWTMLASIYSAEKKQSEAVTSYNRALEAKPDLMIAMTGLGRLELARKDHDAAIVILSKAVATNAGSAEANHLLGEAYLAAKKGSLAVGYLNKAIEIAPVEMAEVHLRLAALYNGAGLKEKAALEYKLFLDKVKDHPDKKKFEQYVKENAQRS